MTDFFLHVAVITPDVDCGVFACMAAYCIAFGLRFSFNTEYAEHFRMHMTWSVGCGFLKPKPTPKVMFISLPVFNFNTSDIFPFVFVFIFRSFL